MKDGRADRARGRRDGRRANGTPALRSSDAVEPCRIDYRGEVGQREHGPNRCQRSDEENE